MRSSHGFPSEAEKGLPAGKYSCDFFSSTSIRSERHISSR
jgi:hypothetical protein